MLQKLKPRRIGDPAPWLESREKKPHYCDDPNESHPSSRNICMSVEERRSVAGKLDLQIRPETPLFSKARLRQVQESIKELNGKSGYVPVRDIRNENTEKFIDLWRPRAWKINDVPVEAKVESVRIEYLALKDLYRWTSEPGFLYQDIRVHGYGPRRNAHTKEPFNPVYELPHERLTKEFRGALTAWKNSSMCRDLNAVLKSKPHLQVKNVIAFGNGSLANGSVWDEDARMYSRWQHALMLSMGNTFLRNNRVKDTIRFYAQDPAYLHGDETFLKHIGIQAVKDPEGFLLVEDDSAVVTFAPDIDVMEIVCAIAKPAVLICEKIVSTADKFEMIGIPQRHCLNFIEEHYDEFPFPLHLPSCAIEPVVYIRKETTDHWAS